MPTTSREQAQDHSYRNAAERIEDVETLPIGPAKRCPACQITRLMEDDCGNRDLMINLTARIGLPNTTSQVRWFSRERAHRINGSRSAYFVAVRLMANIFTSGAGIAAMYGFLALRSRNDLAKNGLVILGFGNRSWSCIQTIEAWLLPIQTHWIRAGANGENAPTIIHGAAVGADQLANDVAFQLGFRLKPCPIPKADWDKYGPRAGYIRNRFMAETYHPHMGIGFGAVQKDPRKIDRSGSGHMLDILNELGIRVTMVARPGDYPGVFR